MEWDQKIISERDLRDYLDEEDSGRFDERIAALLDQQADTWALLRDGLDAFAQIETKRVQVRESEVVIQHNPGRIRSTGASRASCRGSRSAISSPRCSTDGRHASRAGKR